MAFELFAVACARVLAAAVRVMDELLAHVTSTEGTVEGLEDELAAMAAVSEHTPSTRVCVGCWRSSRTNWVWSPSSPRHGLLLGGYADGRRSTLDLLGWEPWADVAEPLAVLRERYNITATPV